MSIYFSASRIAFREMRQIEDVPEGWVKVSAEYYNELLDGQANGKMISSDEDGNPVLLDRPTPSVEYLWDQIRSQRDKLLYETDWTQLSDISTEIKEKYLAYRQALRDITLQSDPDNIVWPSKPE